ncbi:MAG TPA: FAD-dependent oxidoreductase, partial [Cytophagaceae bacterium]
MGPSDLIDVLIIGAGPIGLACALECQKIGFSVLVVEKGCLTNSIYNYPLNMTFFSTSEKLEIGNVPFVCNTPKPHRSEALEYYRRIAQDRKVNIRLYEEVLGGFQSGGNYAIATTKNNYLAKNIIIATGFFDIPNGLNIPGGELSKVIHYYKEPHP